MAGPEGRKPVLSLVEEHAESAFYASRVARLGGPVLVLGAGDGRVALELATREHPVVAVESSEVMARTAEDRRAREAPEVAARMRVVRSDVRALRLAERFRVVIAPQNALGLMTTRDDLEAALATARLHLDQDGAFLLDVINPPEHRAPVPSGAHEPPAEPPPWYRPMFVPHLRERRRANRESPQGGLRRLRVRHFTSAELDAALRSSGFTPLERYGDFSGKPFDGADAVQVVVAQLGQP
jgi:SAM-dependent methyltransferase